MKCGLTDEMRMWNANGVMKERNKSGVKGRVMKGEECEGKGEQDISKVGVIRYRSLDPDTV